MVNFPALLSLPNLRGWSVKGTLSKQNLWVSWSICPGGGDPVPPSAPTKEGSAFPSLHPVFLSPGGSSPSLKDVPKVAELSVGPQGPSRSQSNHQVALQCHRALLAVGLVEPQPGQCSLQVPQDLVLWEYAPSCLGAPEKGSSFRAPQPGGC